MVFCGRAILKEPKSHMWLESCSLPTTGLKELAPGKGQWWPHLGIPEALFVEDVDSYMKRPGNETADKVLEKLEEQDQKYKFMELNLAQKKRRLLKGQIPEIKQTVGNLNSVQKKKEGGGGGVHQFFGVQILSLADNLYGQASAPPTDRVCLCLGSLMLEYDLHEAQAVVYRGDIKRRNKDDSAKNKA